MVVSFIVFVVRKEREENIDVLFMFLYLVVDLKVGDVSIYV